MFPSPSAEAAARELSSAAARKKRTTTTRNRRGVVVRWRSGRDSNPRAAFGDHTISSRARYDHFDTTAYLCLTANTIITKNGAKSSLNLQKEALLRLFLLDGFEKIPQSTVHGVTHPLHGTAHAGFHGLGLGHDRRCDYSAGNHTGAHTAPKCSAAHLHSHSFCTQLVCPKKQKNTRCPLKNPKEAKREGDLFRPMTAAERTIRSEILNTNSIFSINDNKKRRFSSPVDRKTGRCCGRSGAGSAAFKQRGTSPG